MFTQPIISTINQRFSCRVFDGNPVSESTIDSLGAFIRDLPPGPFGSRHRFELLAAVLGDAAMIKGLGTYGFIKNFSAFAVGILNPGIRNLEDFGYQMELIVLKASELGIGNCWLGGTFAKGRFTKAAHVNTAGGELVAAVLALGNIPPDRDPRNGIIRSNLGGGQRKPWRDIFFNGDFFSPIEKLSGLNASAWAQVLDAVRKGPSASNRQPWRLVKNIDGSNAVWQLYLERTPGYSGGFVARLMKLEDLQRCDSGIAMAHFELTARALNLPGSWKISDPGEMGGQGLRQYVATWG